MSKENGAGQNVDPIVEAIRELGRDLGARIDVTNARIERTERTVETGLAQVSARIDSTNERINELATGTVNGLLRIEQRLDGVSLRLDQVVVNTGAHWRDLDRRVSALESGPKE